MIDLLRIAVALAPIASYLIVLGLLRLRKRPTILSGAFDFLLLGLASVGLIAIGPMELFFPRAAYAVLGGWVWLLLMGLYLFALMLIALNLPPRIIVYGLEADELKSQLREILEKESIEAQWMDNILLVPPLGIRAAVETAGWSRVSHLTSVGNAQNIAGWYALEQMLHANTKTSLHSNARHGLIYLVLGVLLVSAAGGLLYTDRVKLQQIMSRSGE